MQADHATRIPKVSVGIPTLNGRQRLLNAIRSVQVQDYTDLEIIVSDNCSTDDTGQLLSELREADPRIKYYRQPSTVNLVANFNFVLQKASAKYFMWLADDDALEAGVLGKYVDFLESNPDYVLVSGQVRHWDGNKLAYTEKGFTFDKPSGISRALAYYRKVTYCGLYHGLTRRELLLSLSPSHTNILGNDWHVMTKLAYLGKIRNFDYPGYNKEAGGVSKNMYAYARSIGYSPVSARFPFVQIAVDAFREIMGSGSTYKSMPFFRRFLFASLAFSNVLVNYYGRTYPRIIGGKLKRFAK